MKLIFVMKTKPEVFETEKIFWVIHFAGLKTGRILCFTSKYYDMLVAGTNTFVVLWKK